MEFLNHPLISLSDQRVLTLGQLLLGIGLLLLTWFGSLWFSRLMASKILTRTRLNQDNRAVIQRVIFFAMLIFITMAVLTYMNIPLTAFAFISGAVAIGVGFGARNIIENFLSGWILMSERPIRIGDVIDLDGNLGTVVSIGHRSTLVKRMDGAHIVVPNSQILESRLINWTLIDPHIRTVIRVGVAYGTHTSDVSRILLDVAQKHSYVLNQPEPIVVFDDFGDSALQFDLYIWVSVTGGKELRVIRSDLRHAIDDAFKASGIVIAFPQQDVHLRVIEQSINKGDS